MNKKGFAISIVLYSVVFLIITVFYIILGILKTRYTVTSNLKNDIIEELNEITSTIASCPGCKFMYITTQYQYGGANNANATEVSSLPIGVVKEDYTEVIASSGKNYFLGFTESNGKIDRAFACGIKGEEPNNGVAFCIEGSTDGSSYTSNNVFLNDLRTGLWQGMCDNRGYLVGCNGAVLADTRSSGYAYVGLVSSGCIVNNSGYLYCIE